MKHLPKHLQPRWRYLAVGLESWPDAEIDRDSFQRACWWAAQDLVGDATSAALDLRVLRFSFQAGDGHAIVRTRRGQEGSARAVLASLESVAEDPLGLRVRGVSGTVRACEEKYIGRAREEPAQRDVVFENDQRRAVKRDDRFDVRVEDAFAGATALDL